MSVRRALHRRGFRYRLGVRPVKHVRSTADLVFPRQRVAVYVDGCFWHSCPEHGNLPKNNREWWREKLARNVERDRRTDESLAESGWCVVRVWEHDCPEPAATVIAEAVKLAQASELPNRRR